MIVNYISAEVETEMQRFIQQSDLWKQSQAATCVQKFL